MWKKYWSQGAFYLFNSSSPYSSIINKKDDVRSVTEIPKGTTDLSVSMLPTSCSVACDLGFKFNFGRSTAWFAPSVAGNSGLVGFKLPSKPLAASIWPWADSLNCWFPCIPPDDIFQANERDTNIKITNSKPLYFYLK